MKASVGCQQLFLIDLIYLLLWYSSKSYLLAEARIKLLLHKTKMLNIVILKVSCKCIWRLLDIFFIVHYMRKNLEGIFSEWLLRSCWTGQRCIFWWWFPNLKMVIDKSRRSCETWGSPASWMAFTCASDLDFPNKETIEHS